MTIKEFFKKYFDLECFNIDEIYVDYDDTYKYYSDFGEIDMIEHFFNDFGSLPIDNYLITINDYDYYSGGIEVCLRLKTRYK